jgi:hypothetical protein
MDFIGIGLLLVIVFFLPVIVYWLNRMERNRQSRRLARRGFEMLPPVRALGQRTDHAEKAGA